MILIVNLIIKKFLKFKPKIGLYKVSFENGAYTIFKKKKYFCFILLIK